MDQEIKGRWLDALRSGKYKQTQGALQDTNGCNCCLGVLARIQEVPSETHNESGFGYVSFDFPNYSGAQSFPPVGFAGIDGDTMVRLAYLNDAGKDFIHIADYIERFL